MIDNRNTIDHCISIQSYGPYIERSKEPLFNGILDNHLDIKSSTKKDQIKENNIKNTKWNLIILSNSNICDERGKLISLETEDSISQNILNFRL